MFLNLSQTNCFSFRRKYNKTKSFKYIFVWLFYGVFPPVENSLFFDFQNIFSIENRAKPLASNSFICRDIQYWTKNIILNSIKSVGNKHLQPVKMLKCSTWNYAIIENPIQTMSNENWLKNSLVKASINLNKEKKIILYQVLMLSGRMKVHYSREGC